MFVVGCASVTGRSLVEGGLTVCDEMQQ
jgi:hypothetical protein